MEPRDVTHFASAALFREWLERHHETVDELWVGYWKKATKRLSLTWEESVDEALCFGWIDGIRKTVDDESYTIRFTPRRAKSIWSHRNIVRFEAMTAEGKVVAAGHAAFEKRVMEPTGGYSYEQKQDLELSDEYAARLRENEAAWRDWETRPPGYRRQVTNWIMSAKREETRERRLTTLIEDCAAGRKVKPLRPPEKGPSS